MIPWYQKRTYSIPANPWWGRLYNTAAALGLLLFAYRMISGTLPGSF